MAFRRFVAASLLAASAVAMAAPAAAQWRPEQRTTFINDCLAACRENPRVRQSQRPLCDDYCLCVVTRGQQLFNAEQFEQISSDFSANRQTAQVKQFQDLAPVCNREAFGSR